MNTALDIVASRGIDARARSAQCDSRGEVLPTEVPYRELFEQLPSGVLVADANGRLMGANLTARRMLGPAFEPAGLTCCELLGCRREGSPFADQCVSQLARRGSSSLPEVRVEIALAEAETPSVWVMAAPIRDPVGVLFEIRPGAVGDRRRRTEPHWTGRPVLRIFTLGRTRVESSEGPLAGEWLGHLPGHLLKYLVCHRGRTVPVDELLEVFWPDVGGTPVANVRQTVHTLRDRLEPRRRKHRSTSFVLARSGGYELDTTAVWIDSDEFEAHARRGLDALATADHGAAEAALERAVQLHGAEFLADEPYSDWALPERERLRALAAKAIRGLCSIRLARGDIEGAIEYLQRLAELHPLDLEIQKELLGMMLRRGRHSEAARRLDVVRRRYKRVFGREPGFGLAELTAPE
jgi:DNA-binding SARP family transcriptional activator